MRSSWQRSLEERHVYARGTAAASAPAAQSIPRTSLTTLRGRTPGTANTPCNALFIALLVFRGDHLHVFEATLWPQNPTSENSPPISEL